MQGEPAMTQETLQPIQEPPESTRGPWVATHGSDDPAVTFTPKDGSGISVVWDWYCLETPEPDRTE
jgi:hypothetical protein